MRPSFPILSIAIIIRETKKDIVIFGYDKADDTVFNLMFSPMIVGGNEYLFYMEIMEKKEKHFTLWFYFFNQRADRISGVFTVWTARELVLNPDRDTLITDGSFMGFRQPKE